MRLTAEEYTDGKCVKYVNNDGTTCNGNNNDQQMKAESLVHYSFIKSNKKMLVVDIQGENFNLTDPEIATLSGHFDEEKHLDIFLSTYDMFEQMQCFLHFQGLAAKYSNCLCKVVE